MLLLALLEKLLYHSSSLHSFLLELLNGVIHLFHTSVIIWTTSKLPPNIHWPNVYLCHLSHFFQLFFRWSSSKCIYMQIITNYMVVSPTYYNDIPYVYRLLHDFYHEFTTALLATTSYLLTWHLCWCILPSPLTSQPSNSLVSISSSLYSIIN